MTPSSTPLRQIPVDESQKFQWQIPFNRTQVVPGDKGFSEVTKSQVSNLYYTLIFTASIPKGIQMECTNLTELLETVQQK